jgi:hypothetical protein
VSAGATAAKATATAEGASSYAAMQALRVLGLPAFGPIELLPHEELDLDTSVLTIDSATSSTDQRIVQGVLTVEAESVLNGVRLVGGLIRIGSIRSLSQITDDAAGKRTSESTFEVSGLTVGGVPAQLTDDGLVVGSPTGSDGPLRQQLQDALNQLLEALQIRVTMLDSEETVDDGTGLARASAGGILVEVAADAQGLPTIPGPIGDLDPNGTYVGTFQLGNTAAAGAATTFEIEDIPFDPPADLGGGLSFDPGGPGVDAGALDGATGSGDQAGGSDDGAGGQQLVRRLTDPFGGRLGLVYLAFTFAVLGLCLMPRLTLPARLGASS